MSTSLAILRSVSGVLDDDVVTGEDMRDARVLSCPARLRRMRRGSRIVVSSLAAV